MISYRAMLDVPAELLRYPPRLLAAERRLRGTPAGSRRLSCRDQTVLALRWFRDRPVSSNGPRPRHLSLWAGPAEPGSAHDITAARIHALPALYRAAALGMPCPADSGYEGAVLQHITATPAESPR